MATSQAREPLASPYNPLVALETTRDDVTLRPLVAFVRRHARLYATLAAAGVALATIAVLLVPRSYTAHASFMPQGRAQSGALASLAAQFGVGLGGIMNDAGRTPTFYATLLGTDDLLLAVAARPFAMPAVGGASRQVTLADYLGARGDSPAERADATARKLRKRVASSVDQRAGTVVITARMRDPEVARDVVRAMLAQVDTFNLRTRQSQATSERRFAEARLAEARADLRQAEDDLEGFEQRNRGDFRNSPQLALLHDRLARAVSLRQQLYNTLAQAYEQARIEEVRDTPVITVVESPRLPVRPDPRPFARALLLGLAASALVATLLGRRRDQRAVVA